jgi:hypothetical protein
VTGAIASQPVSSQSHIHQQASADQLWQIAAGGHVALILIADICVLNSAAAHTPAATVAHLALIAAFAVPCRGQGLELIHNAQLQEKQEQEGPVTIKYVDMGKTSDIYDKVREYQETGKKRY